MIAVCVSQSAASVRSGKSSTKSTEEQGSKVQTEVEALDGEMFCMTLQVQTKRPHRIVIPLGVAQND